MKAPGLSEIKRELGGQSAARLQELCLRLARYRLENKELLGYLLYEAQDEQGYIRAVKAEMEEQFGQMNMQNIYYAKKSVRKVLRMVNKYIRFSGRKETEVELFLFFCRCLHESGLLTRKSSAIKNLYVRQLQKAGTALKGLHEDLQYDYGEAMKALTLTQGENGNNH